MRFHKDIGHTFLFSWRELFAAPTVLVAGLPPFALFSS